MTMTSSMAILAWYKKQLGRLGLKENLMELFKAELYATKIRKGPIFDFSKLRLTPRSAEWLEEYRRRNPNPVNIGKLICETEPIMTREPSEDNPISEGLRRSFEIANGHDICVAIKREPVESETVKNYRNAKGEVIRTDHFNEAGELIMVEEVLDIDFEQVKLLEQASLQAGRLCQKGIPGCRCAEGWPVEEQCPDCRGDKSRQSRCECPPKDHES